ncbi:CAP domain-containing protein [Streptomyces griseocarneus]|uniref:CAP domain-containing protein n=1 Tax=Streptomyces griseocarneus TaxID=51201 RepID=UPI001CCFD8E4|nr:CAP domain-containing protein [Streptomyces griseocarneus]MBZ6477255.1 CAP domain-containing protein [Streptomyces griseocarneus]
MANARKAGAPLPDESADAYGPEDPAEAVTQPIPIVRTGPAGPGRHRGPRRGKRRGGADRTGRTARGGASGKVIKSVPPARRVGLLGASAAVAMGAVAMVSGLLPGGGLTGGDASSPGTSGAIRADGPVEAPAQNSRPPAAAQADRPGGDARRQEQAGAARAEQAVSRTEADERRDGQDAPRGTDLRASRGAERPPASALSAPPSAAPPSAAPSERRSAPAAAVTTAREKAGAARTTAERHRSAVVEGERAASVPGTLADTRSSTAHLVLALVNAERAKAGCRPLRASSQLNRLAQSFSDDMARRGFFDHTDPDGRTPWERAARRGIKNLGGENIARGHPDARTVMDAWMRSSGHRANILNCDYRSMGVGVHHGGNGPWWTQDFGY